MSKGRAGWVAWVLHRISGTGLVLFLLLHIADTALVLSGPGWYNRFVSFYRAPVIRVMEVLLAACLLYHALNGIRVTVMELLPRTTPVQRRLLGLVGAAFVVLFAPVALLMLRPLLM